VLSLLLQSLTLAKPSDPSFTNTTVPLHVVFVQMSAHVSETLPFLDQPHPIDDTVPVQVPLFEQLQRVRHFVESDGPLLPSLLPTRLAQCPPSLQVIPPRPANQKGVGSEGLYELWIGDECVPFGWGDLILLAVGAGFVDGEGPPVIMAGVEGTVLVGFVPLGEGLALADALLLQHGPFRLPFHAR